MDPALRMSGNFLMIGIHIRPYTDTLLHPGDTFFVIPPITWRVLDADATMQATQLSYITLYAHYTV